MEIKNISGAVLRTVKGSSLVGVDLSGADLRGANLTGADLSGPGLTKEALKTMGAVLFDETTIFGYNQYG